MLGRTLQRKLAGFTLIPTDLPEGDITDETKFDALMAKEKPDTVIHCAAMTAVDNCESNQDLAFKLNALGSANVAAACSRQVTIRMAGRAESLNASMAAGIVMWEMTRPQ